MVLAGIQRAIGGSKGWDYFFCYFFNREVVA
jgi:hypothetical protein